MERTVTFRVPPSLAGRLTSAQMRSWLADFLRQPTCCSRTQDQGKSGIAHPASGSGPRCRGLSSLLAQCRPQTHRSQRLGILSGVAQNTRPVQAPERHCSQLASLALSAIHDRDGAPELFPASQKRNLWNRSAVFYPSGNCVPGMADFCCHQGNRSGNRNMTP